MYSDTVRYCQAINKPLDGEKCSSIYIGCMHAMCSFQAKARRQCHIYLECDTGFTSTCLLVGIYNQQQKKPEYLISSVACPQLCQTILLQFKMVVQNNFREPLSL